MGRGIRRTGWQWDGAVDSGAVGCAAGGQSPLSSGTGGDKGCIVGNLPHLFYSV